MDPTIVGKKVKEMYPTYEKYDDATVGQKYILKYGDRGVESLGITDPVKEVARIEAEQKLEDIESGAPPAGTAQQQAAKHAAFKEVGIMKELYGRGDAGNVGTDKDLSLAPSASGFQKGFTGAKRALAGFIGLDNRMTEDINIYTAQANLGLSLLTQAFGSGTPQEQESIRILEKSMPNYKSTDREAKAWFASVESLLGTQKKKELGVDLTKVSDTTLPGQDVPEDTEEPFLREIALKAADIAPGAGGIVGGLAGSILGPGGGVAGAGVGYGGGKVIQNTIRDLLEEQDKTAEEQVVDAASGAAREAAFDALGYGVGKYVLVPLAKVGGKAGGWVLKSLIGGNIDDIPFRNIKFNPARVTEFTKKYTDDIAEFMVKRGYLGDDAIELALKDTQKFQTKFDTIALNKNTKVPVSNIAKGFLDKVKELLEGPVGKQDKIVTKATRDVAKGLITEWESIVSQVKRQGRDFVGIDELISFRKSLDTLIPDSGFVDISAKNLYLQSRSLFNDVIQKTVKGVGGQKGSLKTLGKELNRLYDFLEIVEKTSQVGGKNAVPNLIKRLIVPVLGFGTGGVPGVIIGGAAEAGREAALKDPRVLEKLYREGKVVQPFIKKTLTKAGKAIPQASATLMQLLGRPE